MAKLNKIKNGGSGTKVGNFLRNTVLAPNNLSPYNTPKPQPSSAVPGAGYLGASSGNQTMIPNASIAPKTGGAYGSGPYQNMTPVPQGPSLNGGMSPLPPSNTGRVYTSGPNQNISPLPQSIPTPTIQTSIPLGNRTSGSSSSYSGSSTGGGTPTGTGSLATPNGAATIGSTDFNYNKTPQQIAEEEALKRIQDYADEQSKQNVNQENIYQDTLRQFQGEVDATNQIIAERLRQAQLQGQNRIGQQRAEDFNAGAVGSSFGNAAKDRVLTNNAAVESGIMGEKLKMISDIESRARELGNKYYEQKKAAKEAGLTDYLTAIKGAGAQKEAIASDIATSIYNSKLTTDEITPSKLDEIAKNAGVTVQSIKNAFATVKKANTTAEKGQPASIQEYEYAKSNGYTGSFADYQNEDANRKAVATGLGGLSSQDANRLNNVINKYSADEIVKQAQQVPMIKNIIATVRANPNSASNQLITLYTLVKNLDPNSAVREGELDLAGKTNTFLGKFGDSLTRISKGRVLNPQATLELINGIETLSKEWEQRGIAKKQQYQSQANVLGLQGNFEDYINGTSSGGFSSGGSTSGGGVFQESWN